MKLTNYIAIACIVGLTVFLTVLFTQQPTINLTSDGQIVNERTIVVSGNAELEISPDIAHVYLAVNTRGNTAEEARSSNSQISNKVINSIKNLDISENKIETSNYYLYEDYVWIDGRRENNGYVLEHQLKIELDDLEKIGTLIDQTILAGANRVNNIQFGLSDVKEAKYRDDVLTESLENAKDKAEKMAKTLNLKIIGVKHVTENNYYYTPYNYARGMDMVMAESTKIMPEDVKMSANVQVTYLIN